MKDFFKRHFGLAHHTGFVLVLSLFIILGFFVLAMVAIAIMAAGTDIYVKELNSAQAFYLAEAARNYTLEYYLSYGSNFTDTNSYPNTIPTRTLGAGTFTIGISNRQIKTADITFSGIVSTGTGQDITRRIRQSFNGTTNLPSSLNYAFVSMYDGDELRLTVGVTLSGNWYFNNDTLFGWDTCSYGGAPGCTSSCRLECNVCTSTCSTCAGYAACTSPPTPACTTTFPGPTVTGNIFVDGNAKVYRSDITTTGSITAPGSITTTGSCPNTLNGTLNENTPVVAPQKPAINQTYYDNEINRATNNPDHGDYSYSSTTISHLQTNHSQLLAEGRNLYVRGTLDIDQSITNGPKNIVATNYIGVSNNIRVGQRISLISKEGISTISQGAWIGGTWNGTNMVGAGALLYAKNANDRLESMYTEGASTNWVRIKGVLLTPTWVTTNSPTQFRSIDLNRNTLLEGLVYGKGIFTYFGTVRGSVVIDGPIYDWQGYTAPFHRFQTINTTYNSSLIPLSIKGLYSCSRGDWQELNQ